MKTYAYEIIVGFASEVSESFSWYSTLYGFFKTLSMDPKELAEKIPDHEMADLESVKEELANEQIDIELGQDVVKI